MNLNFSDKRDKIIKNITFVLGIFEQLTIQNSNFYIFEDLFKDIRLFHESSIAIILICIFIIFFSYLFIIEVLTLCDFRFKSLKIPK